MSVHHFVLESIPSILCSLGNERAPSRESFYKRTTLIRHQIDFITNRRLPPELFSNAMDLLAVDGNLVCVPSGTKQEFKTYYINSSMCLVQNGSEYKVTLSRISKFLNPNLPKTTDQRPFNDVAKIYLGLHMVSCIPDATVTKGGHVYICRGCLMFQVILSNTYCNYHDHMTLTIYLQYINLTKLYL